MNDLRFKVNLFKDEKPKQRKGYGDIRSNQNVPYGTFAPYVKQSGIYMIVNVSNNKKYIGSSKDIGSRLIKHFSQLRIGNHPNSSMLQDYTIYGRECFTFEILELTDEDLFNKERNYQNQYALEELYNLQIKDTFHSSAQRNSWKNANKANHKTAEYRQKMRNLKINRIGKFTEDEVLLEVFDSSDDVIAKYNIAKSTLLGCCNGSKKRALGYKWHYLDENNNIMLQGKGKHRDIIQDEDIV